MRRLISFLMTMIMSSVTYAALSPSASASAPVVTDSFSAGEWATDVSVSPDGSTLFVALLGIGGNGEVAVLDAATGVKIKSIPVGEYPWRLIESPDGKTIYVVCSGEGTIVSIDVATQTIVRTSAITINGLYELTIAPDGTRAYATVGGNSLYELSVPSFRTLRTIVLGSYTSGIAISPDGTKVYALRYGGGLDVVSTSSFQRVGTINVDSSPDSVLFSPDGRAAYVSDSLSGTIAVIDAVNDSLITGFSITSSAGNTVVSRDGSRLFVADRESNLVVVVDALSHEVVKSVNVGFRPMGLTLSPDGDRLYVANQNSGSVSVVVTRALPPEVPVNVRAGVRGKLSAEVRWDAPIDNGSPITGYRISTSRDNGDSWSTAKVGKVERTVIAALDGPAQAAWVRIAAVNGKGVGDWSTPVLISTTGFRPSVRVVVQDSDGRPVIGGSVSWAMVDSSARSSRVYGLTDEGLIDFPYAPAGPVNVTLKDGVTVDGARVSGVFHSYLGFTRTALRLPDVHPERLTLRVTLSNGLPVPEVALTLARSERQYQDADCREWAIGDLGPRDYCLDGQYGPPSIHTGFASSTTVRDFTFSVPDITPTKTDLRGEALFLGFSNGQPRVEVAYDDGTIFQSKSVVLRRTTTEVELEDMPWLDVNKDVMPAVFGTPLTIPVEVRTGTGRSAGISGLPVSPKQNVKVVLLPPQGASRGTCKETLSALTDRDGLAKLTVCATKSGLYRFRTQGAAAVASVLVRVRGAAPMPPTNAQVRSLSVGTARVTWNVPTYTGGVVVTGYTVTATAKGEKPVIRKLAANARSANLTGLANATTYSVSIVATTQYGSSDKVTRYVPVA